MVIYKVARLERSRKKSAFSSYSIKQHELYKAFSGEGSVKDTYPAHINRPRLSQGLHICATGRLLFWKN